MKWANFLHFYQPYNQQKDILEAVVNQCYLPLLKGLLANKNARLTVNVSGGLLEALDCNGFVDVVALFKDIYQSGKVEFTSTACYHAFLPLLPKDEIIQQIELNNVVLKKYLGEDFSPIGFFPPEMGYSCGLEKILEDLGFSYMLLDEIANSSTDAGVDSSPLCAVKGSSLKVVFRQRTPSNLIMSGIERDSTSLWQTLLKYNDSSYLVTAMDAETFGHHRPGLEKAFLDIFNNQQIQFVRLTDILDKSRSVAELTEIELQPSTWASSREDILKGIQFISWNDPENILHKWQWELVNLMLQLLNNKLRADANKALASDQFFWASAKPWWSVEMIESGIHAVLEVIENIPRVKKEEIDKAQDLYRKIISTAFEWQRTGKIREMNRERSTFLRIPFKVRTLEQGGTEEAVYQAFIDMMRIQEKQAREKGEYEKAILWRDAVYKIETKCDIYDAINAVDLLRIEISNEQVEKTLNEYTARYRQIRGGQPEQRSN
ncbi:hypothetical protein COT50_01410 [candidate division WWE3 bacterium CG08_land_8_20_14_0_20_41_10]|uniref:Glycoside hydrolase family 57 N-terminal domain-containing protein n=1 Tax=candidate division WWE3 bacterium CG08_land_8_20_14_0_20_41_10 TaxID=1975085 RepID=A0A2H0XC72_UNCKA|nr:MAG: hypothetical protein COT50_01410 [candidate division WWE3 bacterium CG08_land_8_20_14_0_20_41_10]